MGSGSVPASRRRQSRTSALVARAAGIHAHGDVARLVLRTLITAGRSRCRNQGWHRCSRFRRWSRGRSSGCPAGTPAVVTLPGHDAQPGGYQDLAGHAGPIGSSCITASRTASENLVRDLVGCPSVTDSDVKITCGRLPPDSPPLTQPSLRSCEQRFPEESRKLKSIGPAEASNRASRPVGAKPCQYGYMGHLIALLALAALAAPGTDSASARRKVALIEGERLSPGASVT